MIITDVLERNARLYGPEVALVEMNPSEERDNAVTWWDFNLIENANPEAPYRREMTWTSFDRRANRFANLLDNRIPESFSQCFLRQLLQCCFCNLSG